MMIECDGCGKLCEEALDEGRIDNGWELEAYRFGFYGGFTDVTGDDPQDVWQICHDCVVSLMKALPRLGGKLTIGGHSSLTDSPCCHWAWSHRDGKLLCPNDDLTGWEEVSNVPFAG